MFRRVAILDTHNHSALSSYREVLLEHLFAGEIMRRTWLSGIKRLEVLKPQIDDGGYDLILEGNDVVRHVQLKSTSRRSKVARFTVNTGLAGKPSGCVIVLLCDPVTLELGPFLWFGGRPGMRLPDLGHFRIARHTKGNAQGVKLPRPKLRIVPRSAFERVADVGELSERLFGAPPKAVQNE